MFNCLYSSTHWYHQRANRTIVQVYQTHNCTSIPNTKLYKCTKHTIVKVNQTQVYQTHNFTGIPNTQLYEQNAKNTCLLLYHPHLKKGKYYQEGPWNTYLLNFTSTEQNFLVRLNHLWQFVGKKIKIKCFYHSFSRKWIYYYTV